MWWARHTWPTYIEALVLPLYIELWMYDETHVLDMYSTMALASSRLKTMAWPDDGSSTQWDIICSVVKGTTRQAGSRSARQPGGQAG